MELSARSQIGRKSLRHSPNNAILQLRTSADSNPRCMIFLASISLPAPADCAACTVKPAVNAEHSPPHSHVTPPTNPTAAAASVSRCPTIAESINCIITEDICAPIDGSDSRNTRRSADSLYKVVEFIVNLFFKAQEILLLRY